MTDIKRFTSLLWPKEKSSVHISDRVYEDLNLSPIVQKLDIDARHRDAIRQIIQNLPTDLETIAYRQEILEDILNDEQLFKELLELLPKIIELRSPSGYHWPGDSPLISVINRISELDRYIECLDQLYNALAHAPYVKSKGLTSLREDVARAHNDPTIEHLRKELPSLHEALSETNSVTIGINLGPDLQPESAAIISFNNYVFKGKKTLLDKLLTTSSEDQRFGIGQLHRSTSGGLPRDGKLYQELQTLLENAVKPLSKVLDTFKRVSSAPIVALENDIAFYLGAVRLVKHLEKRGLNFCRPRILPIGQKCFYAESLVNLSLAIQMEARDQIDGSDFSRSVVANDVLVDAEYPLLIVTGPNRGGKTTFCRAIGQAQVLFQSGLFVPAKEAKISPVDNILTHFPGAETSTIGEGRLDDEIRRLRELFEESTENSLVLLNEPLTSTSEREALVIAKDFVKGLQLMRARGVLITHLHDLALSVNELNMQSESKIRNLVAETSHKNGRVESTFKIKPGEPTSTSFASEIAIKHGLTYEGLQRILKEKNHRSYIEKN